MFSVTFKAVSPGPYLFVFLGEGWAGRFNVMLLAFLTLRYSTQKPGLHFTFS